MRPVVKLAGRIFSPPGRTPESVAPSSRRLGIIAMILIFSAAMIVGNSIASTFSHPGQALLAGPTIAASILGLYWITSCWIELQTPADLNQKFASRRMALGVAGGIALAAITIGIVALLGGYQIAGWGSVGGALTVVGIMCTISVAEEVLFRGVIFRVIQQRWGTWSALITSALLFGGVHLINPSATIWGALAIAIEAGLMLGAAYVATGSLWLPIGLHLGWNVATVAIFGTIVSGAESQGALVAATTSGPIWLTGGDFGPEASIIAVIVCSIATGMVLLIARRRGRFVVRRR